jgi:hypothetical protein
MHDVDMLPLPGVDYRYDAEAEVRWGAARWNQVDPCPITYSLSNP